jgi:GNAT superfamily N-acetyltransferase
MNWIGERGFLVDDTIISGDISMACKMNLQAIRFFDKPIYLYYYLINFKKKHMNIQELSFRDIDRIICLLEAHDGEFNVGSHWDWVQTFQWGVKVFGLYDDASLVAVACISFFGQDKRVDDAQKAEYAVLCNCFIHPQYRGQGLQRTLIQHRIDFLHEKSITDIRIFTYQDNHFSLHNIEASGFVRDINKGTEKKPCYILCYEKVKERVAYR